MKNFIVPKSLLLSFFLIHFSNLYSQTNEWTWIKGGATSNQSGVYGTKGVASETNKPGGRYYFVSWTDASGNFWLFGGNAYDLSGNQGLLNDLWKYDNSLKKWIWVNGDSVAIKGNAKYGKKGIASPSNNPGGRFGAVAWTDNSGYLWLFGGIRGRATHSDPIRYLNDLWKYNIANNEWTWVKGDSVGNRKSVYGTQGIPSSNNNPGGRDYSVSWKDTTGNLWLFGGADSAFNTVNFTSHHYLNDLWKYNIPNNTWTWIKGDTLMDQKGVYGSLNSRSSKDKPGSRIGGSGWTDNLNNLWLFGGEGFDALGNIQLLNDLWKFDISTKKWTWVKGDSIAHNNGIYGTQSVAADSNKPGCRYFCFSWKDTSGNLWLFGGSGHGKNSKDGFLNDLWKYNIQLNQWTWVKGDNVTGHTGVYGEQGIPSKANNPGSRVSGVTWVDLSGNLWMFGGEGYARANQGLLNDLWKFTLNDGNTLLSAKEANENINTSTLNKLSAILQPNPTTSSFVLNVQPAGKEPISVTVYNTSGRIMQQLKVQPYQQISFGDKLAAGSYIIEVTQGKENITLKAVKL